MYKKTIKFLFEMYIAEETDSNIELKPKVLIVDDLPENLFLLGKTLQKTGYDIIFASNGIDALNSINKEKPDLILLDILMPVMDGFELCRRIKSNKETENIPIIFLTALSDINQIVDGFSLGASDFITKPYQLPEVIERVKTHLELKLSRDMNIKYIEKLKKANEELKNAQEQLKELNSSKDKFFSIISHDLRNPFHGFMKLTETLISDFDELDNEEIKSNLTDIYKSAAKLNKLLDNLLEWSKVQIGKFEIKPELINIKELVTTSYYLYMTLAAEKNINMVNNVSDDINCYTDRNALDTALRNIVNNAIKFTGVGGSITTNCYQNDNVICINIADTGIGMTELEIKNLFRIDTQNIKLGTFNEHGSGIGLILAKELIEKIGGTISVESQLNKGTTFSIFIPKK